MIIVAVVQAQSRYARYYTELYYSILLVRW
jgi:hypothetical protein